MEIEKDRLPVLSLEEQIKRANQAMKAVEAGYYFTDEEMDDKTLNQAPYHPNSLQDKDWI